MFDPQSSRLIFVCIFLQVIKNMEVTASERLQDAPVSDLAPADGAESEPIFPMSFERDLFSDVDMMTMCDDEPLSGSSSKESRARETIEELHRKQLKLERRSEFLLRRLRKMQARAMGRHVSGEAIGLLECIHRTIRCNKEDSDIRRVDTAETATIRRAKEANVGDTADTGLLRRVAGVADAADTAFRRANDAAVGETAEPVPQVVEPPEEPAAPVGPNALKNLVKRLQVSSMIQSNVTSKQQRGGAALRYFGSGSVEHAPARSSSSGSVVVPKLSQHKRHELDRVAGMLQTEMKIVERHVDSDATASSSGGESCDEMQSYNNPHQQFLPT